MDLLLELAEQEAALAREADTYVLPVPLLHLRISDLEAAGFCYVRIQHGEQVRLEWENRVSPELRLTLSQRNTRYVLRAEYRTLVHRHGLAVRFLALTGVREELYRLDHLTPARQRRWLLARVKQFALLAAAHTGHLLPYPTT